jgi:hypothetical protein
MADYISGIKNTPPAYPVKPVQPVHKDRETDRRQKPREEQRDSNEKDRPTEDDGERKPIIDERV